MNESTNERPARPGETCTCGKPATIVFMTEQWGETPYCGAPHPSTQKIPASDDRLTWSLVIDVFDILERNGYRKASDAAGGRAVGILLNLIEAYEGRDQ